MSRVRDVPPVTGAIIWARQIERQLQTYMERVETVLGKGWEQHVDGRRLRDTGSAFLQKLSTQAIFDAWELPRGNFKLLVGSSSLDIRLQGTLVVS